jgi:hypothetical protein
MKSLVNDDELLSKIVVMIIKTYDGLWKSYDRDYLRRIGWNFGVCLDFLDNYTGHLAEK